MLKNTLWKDLHVDTSVTKQNKNGKHAHVQFSWTYRKQKEVKIKIFRLYWVFRAPLGQRDNFAFEKYIGLKQSLILFFLSGNFSH